MGFGAPSASGQTGSYEGLVPICLALATLGGGAVPEFPLSFEGGGKGEQMVAQGHRLRPRFTTEDWWKPLDIIVVWMTEVKEPGDMG